MKMQQRATASSSRASEEDCIIEMPMQLNEAKQCASRRVDGEFHSPRRRSTLLMIRREKWIHAIPVTVFLCVFILWWFSYQVNLEVKDGRIAAIHHVKMPLPLNNSIIELAVVASATYATAPIVPVPQDITITLNNEDVELASLASATDATAPIVLFPQDLTVTLNNEHVELISLASATDATAGIVPVPQDLTANNGTAAHLVSETG